MKESGFILERRPRTWAPQNMGAPRTQGESSTGLRIPDKHELSLGRCPGTRLLSYSAVIILLKIHKSSKSINL